MGTMTDLFSIPLIAVSVLASVAIATDLARGRIYNWLTLPGLLMGLAYAAAVGGWVGLGDSALGAGCALLLYGWLFWLNAMGGGDVKLLMAMGAWGGLAYSQEVAFLSLFLGGVLALFILLLKGRLPSFLRRMSRFLLTLLVRELEVEMPHVDRKLTMPYGIPIGIAGVWTALSHPLLNWGFHTWP
jgi:prepilin peptidase CpaA